MIFYERGTWPLREKVYVGVELESWRLTHVEGPTHRKLRLEGIRL